jgi:hypothetical protein
MHRIELRWSVSAFVVLSFVLLFQRSAPAATSAAKAPMPIVPSVCVKAATPCKGKSICASYPITSTASQIPGNICTVEDEQGYVDIYSWNAFIALNWPARTATCDADTGKSILNVRGGDGSYVVWQTYMPSENVFVNPGTQKPAAWCAGNGLVGGERRVMNQTAKATPAAKLKGGAFLKISEPGGDVLQASGDVLTDQSGRWVRYERLMNRTEYNYIVAGRWNSVLLQAMWNKGQELRLPQGSIEIKSAWKVLTPTEIAGRRYFTTKAIVCNTPDGARTPCNDQPVTLGLAGLHIVQQNHDGGTMFWSTFEQVDNESVFFDKHVAGRRVNHDYAKAPFTELDKSCKPINTPTQVYRVTPIPADKHLNDYYQQLLGSSVFANYRLISTQWTTGAGQSAFGTPANVANLMLETYVQDIHGQGTKKEATGCMACHLDATTNIKNAQGVFQPSGHSFLFLESKFATKGH